MHAHAVSTFVNLSWVLYAVRECDACECDACCLRRCHELLHGDGALASPSASRHRSIQPSWPGPQGAIQTRPLTYARSELFLLLVFPLFYDLWSSERLCKAPLFLHATPMLHNMSNDRVCALLFLSCWPHITAFELGLQRVSSYGHRKFEIMTIEEVSLSIWLRWENELKKQSLNVAELLGNRGAFILAR